MPVVKNVVPALIIAVVILVAGFAHGFWTNRWGDNPDLAFAVEHLPAIPHRIGDWVGTDREPDETARAQFKVAGLRVAVIRDYENEKTGERLQIMAVCGPPGPLTTHTPETCYTGGGFRQMGPPRITAVPVSPAPDAPTVPFFEADFRKTDVSAPIGLKIYWAWRGSEPGMNWKVASNPRMAFASSRAVYKLYVIRNMLMSGSSVPKDDVSLPFISQLLSAMADVLPGTGTAIGAP